MFALLWDVDIIGEPELIQGIEMMQAAFETFRVPLQQSAEQAAESIGNNIVENVDNLAPLAPSTLYQTASYRLGGPLYRTGELLETVTDTSGSRVGSAYSLNDDTATVGLDEETEIGKIGATLARGYEPNNLPPRPFVRVLNGDIDRMQGFFLDYLEDTIDRAFSAQRY